MSDSYDFGAAFLRLLLSITHILVVSPNKMYVFVEIQTLENNGRCNLTTQFSTKADEMRRYATSGTNPHHPGCSQRDPGSIPPQLLDRGDVRGGGEGNDR